MEDWQRLLESRDQVLAGLENLRANKIIGKALEAEIRIDSDRPLLRKYSAALPELFNVSRVDVNPSTDSSETRFAIEKSAAPKCERCWRYVPDVADDSRYPTVCERCANALEAIGYPPYAASGNAE